ncbi:Do family serine endopeptidase [Curvibacter sp. APW13]|uniref:Do family serine endopeptidase n=1 Tax=Curvibacter sp. APW13 TaxID=3077236 RepID=UPI0028DF38C5|nr:Do family serine endopeptidase [Curvibacter sp. APW13]MDT8990383.1 Do family serine endopeptidase [Curvibacter sp. APW13]
MHFDIRSIAKRWWPAGVLAKVVFTLAFLFLQTGQTASTPVAPTTASSAAPSRTLALPDFSQIATEQGPAVVNISVTGHARRTAANTPFGQLDPQDPFYEFFRRFQPPGNGGEEETHALGSGFIVDSDGVVLTNAHVVADADEVVVKLTDRREFKAKVLGQDKLTDVAVLRINAKDLPTVRIGDPGRSKVGEWVVAIGSPFGLENTVTAGIVSAKARTLPDDGYVPFLQTDVPINPGNSGGPLFNLNGEVIGINSQIYSRSGGYQGLSFAIPIDVAMKVEKQLLAHGKVERGRLGIQVQELNADMARNVGLDKPMGALVMGVENGSAAHRAGLQPGDVILSFAGTDIETSGQLPALVAGTAPGAEVPMTLWHNGKKESRKVRIGAVADEKVATADAPPAQGGLGMSVRPLTAAERQAAHVVGGLLVEKLRDGPARKAGLREGDVIVAVNGSLVTDVRQLRQVLQASGEGSASVLVQRGEARAVLELALG